jgi:hypothetical protein
MRAPADFPVTAILCPHVGFDLDHDIGTLPSLVTHQSRIVREEPGILV